MLSCRRQTQVHANYEANIDGWYSGNYGRDDLTTADKDEVDPRTKNRMNIYVDSAYFILVTMSSVGYGDML